MSSSVLRELERDVGDHDAERQRLDPDLLVGVLALGVEELHDVGVVRREVHRPCTLPRAELVGVAERVFEKLHHGDDAAGLVLDLLGDRRTGLTNVAEQERDAAAALGQLQRGVDATRDRLHVVFDAQQEAADQFAALRLARVEERRRRRRKRPERSSSVSFHARSWSPSASASAVITTRSSKRSR